MPAAVFAGSDGIDDSVKNERHLHNFYRVVLTSFATKSASFAARELEQYLPNLSARGSADDMSVGCVLDVEYIKANAQPFEKRKEPYLKLFRIGNLGAADASDDYVQKKEIEAEEGVFLSRPSAAAASERVPMCLKFLPSARIRHVSELIKRNIMCHLPNGL